MAAFDALAAAPADAQTRDLQAEKDAAYRERDRVVALVARMAISLGWRAGLRSHEPDPDPTWDEAWKNVVLIDLPSGQVSWHYHDSERPLFASLPPYPDHWDGHDTAEKYRRVEAAAAQPPPDLARALRAATLELEEEAREWEGRAVHAREDDSCDTETVLDLERRGRRWRDAAEAARAVLAAAAHAQAEGEWDPADVAECARKDCDPEFPEVFRSGWDAGCEYVAERLREERRHGRGVPILRGRNAPTGGNTQG
jgi:hypothetical protein